MKSAGGALLSNCSCDGISLLALPHPTPLHARDELFSPALCPSPPLLRPNNHCPDRQVMTFVLKGRQGRGGQDEIRFMRSDQLAHMHMPRASPSLVQQGSFSTPRRPPSGIGVGAMGGDPLLKVFFWRSAPTSYVLALVLSQQPTTCILTHYMPGPITSHNSHNILQLIRHCSAAPRRGNAEAKKRNLS